MALSPAARRCLGGLCALALCAPLAAAAFEGRYGPLPESVAARMKGSSWRPGCPVPLEDLAYVEVTHWGFDGAPHPGVLVVHKAVAAQVVEIFRELHAAGFRIERMRLADEYGGDDLRSMEDDNTSAFNCRRVTGGRGWSRHSYGLAIDVNPVLNPFVLASGEVQPPAGRAHLERRPGDGVVVEGDPCWKAFTSRGWAWGGTWRRVKDYQHFERTLPARARRGR